MAGQLVQVSVTEGAPSVLVVPYAGGSAQGFFAWRPQVQGRLSLHALELPGRGRCYGEAMPSSLVELADGLAATLCRGGLAPALVCGHSFGALIAFELLRALRRSGAPMPRAALMTGRIAPAEPRSFGLPALDRDALLAYLRDLGGTPDSVLSNGAVLEMTLPVLKTDLELIAGYAYRQEAPLDLDLIAMGGFDDERVPLRGLLAWRDECAGRFEMRMCPGGHFFVEEHRAQIVDVMCSMAGAGMACPVA